jgi:hypothetical protein
MRKLSRVFIALVVATATAMPIVAHATATAAPTNVVATNASPANAAVNAAKINLTWTAVAGAISYIATVLPAVAGVSAFVIVGESTTAYVFEGLTGDTSYSFTVKAKNILGEDSLASSEAKFAAQSIPGDATAVSAIATAAGQITLTWTAPTNLGGLPPGAFKITGNEGFVAETATYTSTTKVINGLRDGTSYTFTIKSSNSLGDAAGVSFASALVATVPGAPTAVTASISGSTVSVGWSAPTNTGGIGSTIGGYTAYLIDNSGNDVTSSAVAGLSTTFSGVADGTYTVKVLATNIVGNGARSTPSSSVIKSAPAAAGSAAADAAAAAAKIISDKVISDKAAADKIIADKVISDKAAAAVAAAAVSAAAVAAAVAKIAADKVITDKAAADEVIADKVISDKAAADKAAAAKKSDYFAVTTSTKNSNTFTTSSSNAQTFTTVGRAIKITIPPVGSKAVVVKSTIKDPSGKIITLPTTTVAKGKSYSSPILSFKKPGVYTMTITVGGVKKTVKITIKK